MRIKSRVRIGLDDALEGNERDAARVMRQRLVAEWNAGHRAQIDEMGLVILDQQSPEYAELRRSFLAKVEAALPAYLRWYENLEYLYSRAELDQLEILELWISGDAGLGGNTYTRVYDISICRHCSLVTVRRQLRDLVTDLAKVKSDLASTQDFSEDLVSERLRQLMEDAGVTGVEFRPVEHARPSRPAKRKYYQLVVHNIIEPLLAPRPVWTQRCPGCGRKSDAQDKGIEQPDPWTEISHHWHQGPWAELHFPRSSYERWDLMRTAETFGGPLSPAEPAPASPRQLISQRLYRLLRQHKISGYWVHPAHLD